MSKEGFMTLAKAAERIGVTPATLRRAARREELKAVKLGPRAWIVSEEELLKWQANPAYHKTGPKKSV